MSGLIRFYLACRKAGIKPILGVELTQPGKPNEHIVLLAKNTRGYGDLCEIISRRHLDADFTFEKAFATIWPDLFCFTNFPHLLELLAATPNRPNLYGELINNSPLTRQRSRALEQKAEALGVPLIVSNNSFFLRQDDWEVHRILTAVGLASTLSRLKPEEYASRRAFFKSPGEIEQSFCNHREAVRNTQIIADQCNTELALNRWILPEVGAPEGFTPDSYLEKLALEGLEENYGGKPEYEQAKGIQEMELGVISKLGYPSYFLMVKEVRDWANDCLRANYRRPRDCSILRGSAANSITFYNLAVSDLDPIRYDLYFQRFLNEDRASPPDADLDFGWDEREKVLDYMIDRWGEERVAITCTTNHFRGRAAFRETAKVFGYSEAQVSKIADSQRTRTKKIDDDEIQHLRMLAEKIKGKPRFLGQHPGGVLITNDPIWRHVALERSGGAKNRTITQIDMHNGIDELGLIKFDILGNGSLSVLRDALQQLDDQALPDPDVWNLEKCYADPRVQDIIAKGRTKGIFYIESPAQTRLNKKAQAQTFEELTITSSLVRPAGSSYCQRFVERHRKAKMGIKDWEFLHPSLEAILKDTYDVCAFQEDITKICHQIANLSYKKADKIRKMMNSLHEGEIESDDWKQTAREFISGCMQNKGLTFEQAKELWERVSSFTGFSFCKSHSASYAQLSFKCTYLKGYYPAQFLAAVISNNHGFYTRDSYLNEARRWGIRILPISINESGIKYWGKHNWIRPGLMHIRALSTAGQERIIQERKSGGSFRNLEDFIRRVDVRRDEVEKLIMVGAFDGFGLAQPESLYLLDGIYGRRSHEPTLFQESVHRQELHPGLDDYTLTQRCLNELHLLGFMLSGNILEILDLHPASKNVVSANRLHEHVGKPIKVFGWPVTERVHTVTESGKPMFFLTLEDKTGVVDVIFWPRHYERFADILAGPGPYEIWGQVYEDWDTFSLTATSIRAVEWSPSQVDFEQASERLKTSFQSLGTYDDVQPVVAA
jgi:error-prone DNA polymerase